MEEKLTAIVLAGGLGTRLRSMVNDLPKCMADVAGKPFLSYVIDHLRSNGVQHFIFSLGYMHEVISYFINKNYSGISEFSIEEEPLGTGGAIHKAAKLVKGKTAVVVNGDTLYRVDLGRIIPFHTMCGADCTLALKPMENIDRYGVVELNNDYSIRDFREKQYYASGLINGGVYFLNTAKFLHEELPEKFSFEKDYLEKFYANRRMYGVIQDKYFIDIGIPEDYQRAQTELKYNG